eukprot:299920-Amorphochlora_amoeboformis.AAC.1
MEIVDEEREGSPGGPRRALVDKDRTSTPGGSPGRPRRAAPSAPNNYFSNSLSSNGGCSPVVGKEKGE